MSGDEMNDARIWRKSRWIQFAQFVRRYAVTAIFLVLAWNLTRDYIEKSAYTARVHDINGHLEHIDYVYERHEPPATPTCWQCYQPDAYYFLAAATLRATDAHPSGRKDVIGTTDVARPNAKTLQKLSALLAFGAIAFALFAVRALAATTYECVLASAIVVYWPTVMIESCKIGNDTLYYFFSVATILALVAWQRTERAFVLVLAAVAASLALNTKVNGTIAVLLVVATVLTRIVRPPAGAKRVPSGVIGAILAIAVGVAAILFLIVHYKGGSLTNHNAEVILRDQLIPNGLEQYTNLDLASFKRTPWPFQVESGMGREFFWNYLFRTSLFGEWRTGTPALEPVAYHVLILAAALLPFVAIGFVSYARAAWTRSKDGSATIVFALLGWLAFAILFRWRYPYISANDFRYVIPIVVPAAMMMARGAAIVRRWAGPRIHVAALAGFLVAAFCYESLKIVLEWS